MAIWRSLAASVAHSAYLRDQPQRRSHVADGVFLAIRAHLPRGFSLQVDSRASTASGERFHFDPAGTIAGVGLRASRLALSRQWRSQLGEVRSAVVEGRGHGAK